MLSIKINKITTLLKDLLKVQFIRGES